MNGDKPGAGSVTALHPRTISATRYGQDPITDPFGFPLRLRTATRLGYKNPQWITAIEVTNTKPRGHWVDRGFNEFGGRCQVFSR